MYVLKYMYTCRLVMPNSIDDISTPRSIAPNEVSKADDILV